MLGLRVGITNDQSILQFRIARRLHVSIVTVANLEKSALEKVVKALEGQPGA